MATSVVVVKSCVPEKALFAVPPLFLFDRGMQAASKTFAPWGMETDAVDLTSCSICDH